MTLDIERPPRSRLRRRAIRSAVGGAAAILAGLALAVGMTGQAQAAPSPSDIETQIDNDWNKVEPIIEKHNQVKIDLANDKAKVDALTKAIKPLADQVDAAFGRVSNLSVEYFKSGRAGVLDAVLSAPSSAALPDELTLLDALARNEKDSVKNVLDLKAQYDQQKKPLDDLVAKLSSEESDLASQENTINNDIKHLNDLRMQAYGTTGGTGQLRPAPCPSAYDGSIGSKAAQVACSEIGKRYVWGSEGPNTFDCSGLTMYAWGKEGVTLRHYTMWQWEDTTHVTKDQLRPGDLVFFYSDLHHMGMYVGNGYMVHAPHSGDVVRMALLAGRPIVGYGRPH